MRAAGLNATKIAQALGEPATRRKVDMALQRIPDVYEQVARYRDNLRLRKMQNLFDADAKLWRRIDKDVDTAEAKDVDALFRAAHAAEKIAASVSGEAQKVEMTAPPAPNMELKVLIQALGLDGFKELTG